MTTFYICRHSETANNKNKRLSGWIDTPLTENGIHNIASFAKKLESIQFDTIVSSDLGRAFITAYLISRKLGYAAEIKRYKDFREVNYGDLNNTPYTGTDCMYSVLSATQNTHYVPPHGESLAHMQHRVMACITKISQKTAGQTILLVAHDGTINAVYATFTGQDIGIVDALAANPHDFVARFTVEESSVRSFIKL